MYDTIGGELHVIAYSAPTDMNTLIMERELKAIRKHVAPTNRSGLIQQFTNPDGSITIVEGNNKTTIRSN